MFLKNAKWIGHLIGLFPSVYLIFLLASSNLGVNPIERLIHETGWWALVMLLASLAISPAVNLSKQNKMMPLRKYFGLYAFFYALIHFLFYLFFDLSLDFSYLFFDIKDRPYITVGFFALVLLIPLAITSLKTFRRRLGKRWIYLHRTVYLVNALALLHYYWRIRADYAEFIPFIIVFILLIGYSVIPLVKNGFFRKRFL